MLRAAESKCLRQRKTKKGTRRQVSEMTHLLAIPIDLIRTPNVRHVKHNVGARCRTLHEVDMSAIPRKARVGVVPLLSPGTVDAKMLPGRIVQYRRGPDWIIADMKLP